jgi:hypothetical protein
VKIFITAKTGSKKEFIEQIDDTHFMVSVKERPIKGKANEAIKKSVAAYLSVPQSHVILCSGASSKHKVFVVD